MGRQIDAKGIVKGHPEIGPVDVTITVGVERQERLRQRSASGLEGSDDGKLVRLRR